MASSEREIMEQLYAASEKLHQLQQEIHELNLLGNDHPDHRPLIHRLLGESHELIDQLSMLDAYLAARILREQSARSSPLPP